MADDPLQTFLDRTGLSKAQKAGLWDLYHAAKNTEDLDSRLKTLDLPKELKADLWDLKSSEAAPSKPDEPSKVEPSAGYWEDRGIAGKVWHPVSGVKEGDRVDNQVLGVPPELAAIGAGSVGRAVVAPGLNAAGRVAAGAAAAAGQVAPIIKYELAHQGLKAIGVPEPLATAGAVLVGGYRRGGAAKEAAPAIEAEATTAAETTPMGFPKPTEPQLSPLELTRKLRAEHQAKMAAQSSVSPLKPSPDAVKEEFKAFLKAPAESANRIKLNATETALGFRLMKRGVTADEAMELIKLRRSMPAAWKALPTDEEVEAIVQQANQAGRMTR